ncbi:hypothetical protein RB2654_14155 [Rhodobacterales bacterium HTCC2654]|uniref:Uncharacterized protein n=1 Tax=Maritimibacter alkaliphilus HTCC2654 TaxID=314271 RepID=A3VGN0_9RHOB|nr:hypothetical protein RB2654_14155 [Rhodobacterales bacterium HTCC2654] [Maritimibacter alkaliphilus HTCC2654]
MSARTTSCGMRISTPGPSRTLRCGPALGPEHARGTGCRCRRRSDD